MRKLRIDNDRPSSLLDGNFLLLTLCETWNLVLTFVNSLWPVLGVVRTLSVQNLYHINSVPRRHVTSESWWILASILVFILIIRTMNSINVCNWLYILTACWSQCAWCTRNNFFGGVVILDEEHDMKNDDHEAESFSAILLLFVTMLTRSVLLSWLFCTLSEKYSSLPHIVRPLRVSNVWPLVDTVLVAKSLDNLHPLKGRLESKINASILYWCEQQLYRGQNQMK